MIIIRLINSLILVILLSSLSFAQKTFNIRLENQENELDQMEQDKTYIPSDSPQRVMINDLNK